jgi:tetratricopeptide (TPR) repeat protein
MTRLVVSTACVGFCLAVWPRPAAAQKQLFIKGLEELTRAMVATSADEGRVRAAIDTMAEGLAGWDRRTPPADSSLLDDNVPTAVLPLAAYADGFSRIVRGDYSEAIRSLRRAAATTADERTRLVTAGLLVQEGRPGDAERVLLTILEAWPESAIARWWLGRIYDTLNRVADARREYEAVLPVALAGRGQLYSAIGRLARVQGDFAGALDAFTRRVQVSPADPAAHKDLARLLLDHDRSEEALTELAAALAIDPRDAETHAVIGRIRLNASQYMQAVTALRRAVELSPNYTEARYALATALMRMGNTQEAARELERVERAQRQMLADRRRTMSLDVLKEEAALRTAEGSSDRAVALWQQVIDREPGRPSNHLGLAAALARAGRIDMAISQYENAVTLGADPVVYRQLAELYAKVGRIDDAARARAMYERALQGDGSNRGTAR